MYTSAHSVIVNGIVLFYTQGLIYTLTIIKLIAQNTHRNNREKDTVEEDMTISGNSHTTTAFRINA